MRLKLFAVSGDILLLVGFALLGRVSHSERGSVGGVLTTVAPFIVGWSISALSWRAYGPEVLAGYRRSLLLVFRTWTVGCFIGLLIRSAEEHHLVPPSFAAVAFIFNLLTLGFWRLLLLSISRRS